MDKSIAYTIVNSKVMSQHTEIHNITWNIPKFSQILQTETMCRKCFAPKNTVVEVPESKFQLKMSFFARGNDIFLIDIYYLSLTAVFLEAKLDMNMVTQWNRESIINVSQNCHGVQANFWQHIATIKNISKLLIAKSLDVHLEFIIYRDFNIQCHNIPQIADDLINLLMDGSYSDVTMVSAEGVEFRVHKSIVTIRSKVLKAHFEHNTNESVTNIVETIWETAVLRELLTFVYTNDAPHIDDDPEKLFAAANYYQLEGLKALCEKAILKRLTVENAIETLQFAEMHSAISLRDSTLEFIKHGRARMIIESQGWANIPMEILKNIYKFVMADETDNSDILAAALNELESKPLD